MNITKVYKCKISELRDVNVKISYLKAYFEL